MIGQTPACPAHPVPDMPEQLLQGRMSILQNWVFDYIMKVKGSISPFDRSVYIAAYSSPGAITADDGWYQTFVQVKRF